MTSTIGGVELRQLTVHPDSRGDLREFYRQDLGSTVMQWNLLRSVPFALRGMHVHPDRADHLMLVSGQMDVFIQDVRPESPSFGTAETIPLQPACELLIIPVGVLHGVFFSEPSITAYGLTAHHDPAQELGCHWADPAVKLAWPHTQPPIVSERDQCAGSFSDMYQRWLQRQAR